MLSKGRLEQLAREKEHHPTARTSGELSRLLGISDATFKRWRKRHRIPEPAYHSVSGWPLWSAEQVRALIHRRMEQ